MESVKKTKKRKLPPWMYLMIIFFLLLTAGIAFKLSKPELPPIKEKAERIELMRADKGSITSVAISPPNAALYTILQQEEGIYSIEGKAEYPLQQRTVDEIFDTVSSMVADHLIISNVSSLQLADFGVTDASLHFTVHLKDGTQSTWYFGHEIPMEIPQRYMYDGKNIYMTSINYPDIVNFSLEELHPVPDINCTPDIIDGITLKKSDDIVSLHYQHGLWQLTSPCQYPADPEQMKALLEKLGDMRLAVYVEDATPQNLAKYGLDTPQATLILNIAPSVISVISPEQELLQQEQVVAHEIELQIGNSFSNIGFYCLFDHIVYKATNLSMGFLLEVKSEPLLLKNPVNISLNAMHSMTVVRPKGETKYEFIFTEQLLPNNDFVTDEAGNIQYDLFVKKNGLSIDATQFIADYTMLNRLHIAGIIPENVHINKEQPILSITLHYEQGKREISFLPYDALHVAVSINGVVRHYMEKEKLDTISL